MEESEVPEEQEELVEQEETVEPEEVEEEPEEIGVKVVSGILNITIGVDDPPEEEE